MGCDHDWRTWERERPGGDGFIEHFRYCRKCSAETPIGYEEPRGMWREDSLDAREPDSGSGKVGSANDDIDAAFA